MKKIILLILLLIPINVFALEFPEFNSYTVLIYDNTDNKVLYEKNNEEKRQIASLTKMLTVYTALDYEENLNKEITITDPMRWAVNWELSIHKIQTGEVYTVDELLHMCIMESAADACMAVSFDIAGSESKMAELVDKKAKELELTDSSFSNITGLDHENNYSTANDLLKFMKIALNNSKFREIFTCQEYQLRNGSTIYPSIYGWAHALGLELPKLTGDKTGFTDLAGLCLAYTLEIDDHEMIVISLGAPTDKGYHVMDAVTIMNYLDDNYNYEVLYSKDRTIKTLDIELSKQEKYDIKVLEDVKKFLPKDYDESLVSYKYEGKETLSYLDKAGNKIGKISYYYDNELLYEQDIILDMNIEMSYKKVLNKYKIHLIVMLSLVILLMIMIKLLHSRKVKVRKYGKKEN